MSEENQNQPARRVEFVTTQWLMLKAAANSQATAHEASLGQLCREYWYPLYAFVRRSGNEPEKARDLTQGFFEYLLERKGIGRADPELGRFRTFLLAAMKNYLRREHRDANRQKRGGGQVFSPLEWDAVEGIYSHEPSDNRSPERVFDRNWARAMVEQVMGCLEDEYEAAGETERFRKLRFALDDPGAVPYGEIAKEIGLSEAGTKSAAHRLRTRFRELFREVIAAVVDDPREVDDEIRYLLSVMA